jgi:guanylate kinase
MKTKNTVTEKSEERSAQMGDQQARPDFPGNLIVFTGPSGVGKGTISKELITHCPGLVKSVSVTTRDIRPGEQEGVHYFFRTPEEFDEMRHNNELMEWAEFAGAYYGTPIKWVEAQLAAGLDVMLEIEVQGAKQIMQRFPHAVLIFISPPTFDALRQRLKGRATETLDKIDVRLAKAQQEMREKHLFHYEVVNDNIEEAVKNLVHIVYAERCRIRNSR